MTREQQWRMSGQLSLILVAMAVSSWGAHASAQDKAIPDSVAVDVAGSKTKAAAEATFAAPPPDVRDVSAEEAAAAADAAADSAADAADSAADAAAAAGEAAEAPKAEVDWNLNAGGAINTGNARSWNVNAGSDFLLKATDHRLTINSLFNYGRADAMPSDPASSYATVARQFFFNARYDYFFTKMDAVWTSLAYRWDPLSGFRAQLIASAGYLRAFIKTEKHYLAGRIGYSYTFENYVLPSVYTSNSNIQGLLAALDYENKLNEHVEFLSSITTIYNLNNIPVQNAQPFQDIRIYLTAALKSSLTDKLAFEARLLMLYDRIPAGPALVPT
ncbi:MAG: DUF481 domain-containing protein, partial [Polyangiales bacterium]